MCYTKVQSAWALCSPGLRPKHRFSPCSYVKMEYKTNLRVRCATGGPSPEERPDSEQRGKPSPREESGQQGQEGSIVAKASTRVQLQIREAMKLSLEMCLNMYHLVRNNLLSLTMVYLVTEGINFVLNRVFHRVTNECT